MEAVFLKLLNMSILAGWLVLAVVVLRLMLKKAPKWIACLLWALVAVRLICPVSLKSVFSLIPSAETVPQDIMIAQKPMIHSGVRALNSFVNPVLLETLEPTPGDSVNPAQVLVAVACVVWILGLGTMLLYALISYMRIYKKVAPSIKFHEYIYICDYIETPFILGIIKPRIYLPSTLDKEKVAYVVAHENAHLKRRDYLWKPLGFALLSVYWFHPLMWLAYALLCRDIELACDEKVIKQLGEGDKKAYSDTLLACSIPRRMIVACPLAFGEVGVKERVKTVLNYKKPPFWIVVTAIAACVVVAVCFLTNPKKESKKESDIQQNGVENSNGAQESNVHLNDGEKVYDTALPILIQDPLEIAIHEAILKQMEPREPDELFRCENHVILDTVTEHATKLTTVYAMELTQIYDVSDGAVKDKGGSHMPVALTFEIGEEGEYTLKEYWMPDDGSYYVSSIREKFPDHIEDNAIDTQKYIYGQIINCYEQAVRYANLDTDAIVEGLLAEMVGNPGLGSDVASYIQANHLTYRELRYYGRYTLQYCFKEFLKGGQTDLRGALMAELCRDIGGIYGEALLTDYEPVNGQAWFEELWANAEALDSQYNRKELAEYYPMSYLLMEMISPSPENLQRVYAYRGENKWGAPAVSLNGDGTFTFTFSLISSYIGVGTYTEKDDRLTLYTDDGQYVYVFDIIEDNLVFDADASSSMTWFADIPDGAVFE